MVELYMVVPLHVLSNAISHYKFNDIELTPGALKVPLLN